MQPFRRLSCLSRLALLPLIALNGDLDICICKDMELSGTVRSDEYSVTCIEFISCT